MTSGGYKTIPIPLALVVSLTVYLIVSIPGTIWFVATEVAQRQNLQERVTSLEGQIVMQSEFRDRLTRIETNLEFIKESLESVGTRQRELEQEQYRE